MWLGAVSYSGPNRNNWGKIEEMNQSIMTQANSIKIRAVKPLGHYDYNKYGYFIYKFKLGSHYSNIDGNKFFTSKGSD